MGHHVAARAARQVAHLLPHPAQPGHVEEVLAVAEALLHPGVVRPQVAAAAGAAEGPAAGADRPHPGDELGQVARERRGLARILGGGHGAGQPGLHRPRQRVPGPRLAERDRLGGAEPGPPGQFPRRLRLGLQLAARPAGIPRAQREPGGQPVADPEDRVDGALRRDGPDRQVPPLRELVVHQRAHGRRGHRQLVSVHPHPVTLARPGRRPQLSLAAQASGSASQPARPP